MDYGALGHALPVALELNKDVVLENAEQRGIQWYVEADHLAVAIGPALGREERRSFLYHIVRFVAVTQRIGSNGNRSGIALIESLRFG